MPNVEFTFTLPPLPDPIVDLDAITKSFEAGARAAQKAMRAFGEACHHLKHSALGLYDLTEYRGPPLRVKLARKVLRHSERYDDRMVERARHTAFRIHNRMMLRVFKSSSDSRRQLLLFGGGNVIINTRKSRRWRL